MGDHPVRGTISVNHLYSRLQSPHQWLLLPEMMMLLQCRDGSCVQTTDTLVCSWTTSWIGRLMWVQHAKKRLKRLKPFKITYCVVSTTEMWPLLSSLLWHAEEMAHLQRVNHPKKSSSVVNSELECSIWQKTGCCPSWGQYLKTPSIPSMRREWSKIAPSVKDWSCQDVCVPIRSFLPATKPFIENLWYHTTSPAMTQTKHQTWGHRAFSIRGVQRCWLIFLGFFWMFFFLFLKVRGCLSSSLLCDTCSFHTPGVLYFDGLKDEVA